MVSRRTFLQASLAGLAAACARNAVPSDKPTRKLTLLVLGGTGFLGPAVVEAALAHGHTVTLFNRGRTHTELFPQLEKLRGDRDGKLDALRGRSWDAVIDDTGFVPRIVRQSAELLAPNVKRYVYTSTLSVYSDEKTLNQDETAPLAKMPAEEPNSEEVRKYYSPLKAACEDVVRSVYGERATIIRPGYIIGPRDPYDRLTYWAVRCKTGGDVVAPGDGHDPTQFIDVRDLGAFFVTCVERDHAGAHNATGPAKLMTMKEFLEFCQMAAGTPSKLVWASETVLRRAGVNPDDVTREVLPLWAPNHALGQVSIAKAMSRGLTLRPTVETARDTIAWWQTLPEERRARMRGGLTAENETAVLAELRKT